MIDFSTQEQEETAVAVQETQTRELILHNDDFNTFDHVIDCLIAVCNHTSVQAEQCAYIVHYNGKCSIKKDYIEKLEPMYKSLLQQNLTAEIR